MMATTITTKKGGAAEAGVSLLVNSDDEELFFWANNLLEASHEYFSKGRQQPEAGNGASPAADASFNLVVVDKLITTLHGYSYESEYYSLIDEYKEAKKYFKNNIKMIEDAARVSVASFVDNLAAGVEKINRENKHLHINDSVLQRPGYRPARLDKLNFSTLNGFLKTYYGTTFVPGDMVVLNENGTYFQSMAVGLDKCGSGNINININNNNTIWYHPNNNNTIWYHPKKQLSFLGFDPAIMVSKISLKEQKLKPKKEEHAQPPVDVSPYASINNVADTSIYYVNPVTAQPYFPCMVSFECENLKDLKDISFIVTDVVKDRRKMLYYVLLGTLNGKSHVIYAEKSWSHQTLRLA